MDISLRRDIIDGAICNDLEFGGEIKIFKRGERKVCEIRVWLCCELQ
jgi:hypothetical protein